MFIIKFKFFDKYLYATEKYEFVKNKNKAARFRDKKDAINFLKTLIHFNIESEEATSFIIEKDNF